MKLDKIIKNTLIAMPFMAMPVMAQSNINGNVESVPSKTPAFARLTFMNLADTTQKNIAFTDSLTGDYSLLNVPNGPTERKVEVTGHWLYKDTVNVNGNEQMDFQIIKDIGNTSPYHPNILNVVKTLTATLDILQDPEIERWNDYAFPVKFCANNDSIPSGVRQYLDSALNDIIMKSDGKVQFNEVFTEPDTGIVFRYRETAGMPCGGASGCMYYDSWFPDNSPKHMTIYINIQQPSTQFNSTFRKELGRAMPMFAYSTDPDFIMAINTQAQVFHEDEGKASQIMYTLKHNTNMRAHRETKVTWPLLLQTSVSINNGWNILSVPLLSNDMTGASLFPSAISPFYTYSSGYQQVTTLQNGKGYWSKFDGNQSVTISGNLVNTNDISVTQGWNLVGPFNTNVPVSGITSTPPNIIVSPFFGYENGYTTPTELLPGKGYWIKINASGTIHLNTSFR